MNLKHLAVWSLWSLGFLCAPVFAVDAIQDEVRAILAVSDDSKKEDRSVSDEIKSLQKSKELSNEQMTELLGSVITKESKRYKYCEMEVVNKALETLVGYDGDSPRKTVKNLFESDNISVRNAAIQTYIRMLDGAVDDVVKELLSVDSYESDRLFVYEEYIRICDSAITADDKEKKEQILAFFHECMDGEFGYDSFVLLGKYLIKNKDGYKSSSMMHEDERQFRERNRNRPSQPEERTDTQPLSDREVVEFYLVPPDYIDLTKDELIDPIDRLRDWQNRCGISDKHVGEILNEIVELNKYEQSDTVVYRNALNCMYDYNDAMFLPVLRSIIENNYEDPEVAVRAYIHINNELDDVVISLIKTPSHNKRTLEVIRSVMKEIDKMDKKKALRESKKIIECVPSIEDADTLRIIDKYLSDMDDEYRNSELRLKSIERMIEKRSDSKIAEEYFQRVLKEMAGAENNAQ